MPVAAAAVVVVVVVVAVVVVVVAAAVVVAVVAAAAAVALWVGSSCPEQPAGGFQAGVAHGQGSCKPRFVL